MNDLLSSGNIPSSRMIEPATRRGMFRQRPWLQSGECSLVKNVRLQVHR
jgi:hypothetical protein